MWFQLKVLAVLLVLCTLISWCAPTAGPGTELRESALRALDCSLRDFVDYRDDDDHEEVYERPVAPAASRRVPDPPRRATTTAGRKRISAYTMKRVGAKYAWRCARCGEMLRDDFHVDHIVPLHQRLALGKSLDNEISNLQPLCPSCHSLKNHKEQSR